MLPGNSLSPIHRATRSMTFRTAVCSLLDMVLRRCSAECHRQARLIPDSGEPLDTVPSGRRDMLSLARSRMVENACSSMAIGAGSGETNSYFSAPVLVSPSVCSGCKCKTTLAPTPTLLGVSELVRHAWLNDC